MWEMLAGINFVSLFDRFGVLYVLCGHLLGKGLTSWLSFVVSTVRLSLSHWYPESGVVLDCIGSWSLHPYIF